MKVKSLSASSIKSYLGCGKRFLAEQVRVGVDSAPGQFGTAIHYTLEHYFRLLDGGTEHKPEMLAEMWTSTCNAFLGLDAEEYMETGHEMLARYCETMPVPHKILSREVKESFELLTESGESVKINYICDRVDEGPDGIVEVIDYKTQWARVTPDAMRGLVQPGLYAVAMRRKYGVDQVRVTYEMLRQDPINVSTLYSSEDMDRIERMLADVAQRILDDDDPKEKLNSECVYCIRKGVCETLRKATELGWTPTLPITSLVARRDDIKNALKAQEQLLAEIDEVIIAHLKAENVNTDDIGDFTVSVSVSKRGAYDATGVFTVLGESAIPYMKVQKTALDKVLKRKRDNPFTAEEREAVEGFLTINYGEPQVHVVKKGIEE
jgi:hypothetical protein